LVIIFSAQDIHNISAVPRNEYLYIRTPKNDHGLVAESLLFA